MKNLIILMLIPFLMEGQKIKENKKDDMTGNHIIRTSSERITGGMSSRWIKSEIVNINKTYYINLHTSISGVFFIVSKGADVTIKLDNDSLVKAKALDQVFAKDGMGGKQGTISCKLTTEQVLSLKSKLVTKIRIVTSDGYVDFDIKNTDIIKAEIELIEKELSN